MEAPEETGKGLPPAAEPAAEAPAKKDVVAPEGAPPEPDAPEGAPAGPVAPADDPHGSAPPEPEPRGAAGEEPDPPESAMPVPPVPAFAASPAPPADRLAALRARMPGGRTLLLGAAIFLLLLIAHAVHESFVRGSETHIAKAELQAVGRVSLRLTELFADGVRELARMAAVEEVRNLNPTISAEVLEFYRDKVDAFEAVALIDREGGLVSATRAAAPPIPVDVVPERLDLAALAGSGLVVGRESRRLHLVRVVNDSHGHALGFLVARIRPRSVREAVLAAALGEPGRVSLLDRQGRIVDGSAAERDGPPVFREGDGFGTRLVRGKGRAQELATVLPVVGFDLRLHVARPAGPAWAFLARARVGLFLLALLLVLAPLALHALPRRADAEGTPVPAEDAAIAAAEDERLVAALLRDANYAADLDALLQGALARLIDRFRLGRASVMMRDAATDELDVVAVRVFDPLLGESARADFIKRVSLFAGEGVAGRAVKEGKPFLVRAAGSDARFKSYEAGSGLESAVATLAVVPLVVDGEAFGAVNLVNPRDGAPFGEAELALAARLALELARVVENAALYHAAVTDPETGLHLPAHFARRLEREAIRLRRHGQPVGVVIARYLALPETDPDLGWAERRLLQKELAAVAREAAGEGATVARHRSEGEVVLLLPRQGRAETLAVARRIVAAFAEREFAFAVCGAPPSVRAGAACEEGHAFAAAELLKRADRALFRALSAPAAAALSDDPGAGTEGAA